MSVEEKVRLLSRLICEKCDAKDYTKCGECQFQRLLSEIVRMLKR